MGRPISELSIAMLRAAEDGPGTVQQLAARALVGRHSAKYTASRLLARGQLVKAAPGRPAVLKLPEVCTETTCSSTPAFAALLAAWSPASEPESGQDPAE